MHDEVAQALQLPLLDVLTKVVVGTALVWSVGLIWLTFIFIRKFKVKNKPLWEEIGRPTIFRKNISLMKFLFSNRTSLLSKDLASLARILRMMIYIGVVYLLSLVAAFYYLWGSI